VQLDLGRRAQAAHRRHQLEAGPHCALRVVLARDREPEIGQDAVAQMLGDVAAERLDHRGASTPVGADQGEHVLVVERAGEPGGAHHVAEQDRELAVLGAGARPPPRTHGRGGLEQALALTQGQPELAQVRLAQLGQEVEADVLGEEPACYRLLVEPVLGQPRAKLLAPLHRFPPVPTSRATIRAPWSGTGRRGSSPARRLLSVRIRTTRRLGAAGRQR
jgi:hypothetical protein